MTERRSDRSTRSGGTWALAWVHWLRPGQRALAFVVLLAAFAGAPPARAGDPALAPSQEADESAASVGEVEAGAGARMCVDAHERAQVERLEGHLLAARAELDRCSVDTCPAAIRRDCLGWKVELATAIPTVVIETLLDDKPASVAEVRIDDAPLGSFVPGLRLSLDPGPHRALVRLTNGAEREVRFELRQGEQNRVVVVEFVTSAVLPSPQEERVEAFRPVPLVTWILLGSTLVGAGVGIAFGADAISQRNAAEADCAPLCSSSISDSVRASAVTSDIGWIVAGASAVGATVTFVLRPTIERPVRREAGASAATREGPWTEVALETRSIPGGALLRFRGSF